MVLRILIDFKSILTSNHGYRDYQVGDTDSGP